MGFEHLLSPLQVGPVRLRNRVLVTAHVPGLEAGGLVSEDYIAYQRAKAAGGAGLQITGSSHVHETGGVGGGRGLDASKPESVAAYARLAEAIHAEGGRFLVQLGHAGATVNDTDAGRPLLAPSPVMSGLVREMPKEMTVGEIDMIVEAHAQAAARVAEGGLDGVEILAAFGYLTGAFLSPYSNKREDDYGGPLENRLRFALRVIAAVRAALGQDKILGVRMPGDEKVEGGLGPEALQEIARHLAASGQVDYLNVIAGTNYDRKGRMLHWPPAPAPEGLFVPLAAGIKRAVDIPVFTTGRITDPAMAERIVAEGEADMVGMTRAQISDPGLVRKLIDGRPEDIRPCVGANLCIARAMEGKPIRCFHNPEAARERAWGKADRAETPKHVAVIGGGPAGLEAARVAAERGHRVTLYEASDRLGGQLRLWAEAPMTREFGKTLAWYERQLTKLQVSVRSGARVTAEDLLALAHRTTGAHHAVPALSRDLPDAPVGSPGARPGQRGATSSGIALEADAIILATGARPLPGAPMPGAETSTIRCRDPWQVLQSPPAGAHVVVVDEGGGRTGLAAADLLLEGNRVTVVTSEFAVAEMVTPTVRTPVYERFLKAGAAFRPTEAVTGLDGRVVLTENLYSGAPGRIDDVDVLVDWRGAEIVDDLSAAAESSGKPVYRIGDCVTPRQVHIAISEGAMAARKL